MKISWSRGDSLSLSFALHVGAFFVFCLIAGHRHAHEASQRSFAVELVSLTQPHPQLSTRSAPRVVQTAMSRAAESSVVTDHLGQQNQQVDRQTVNRLRIIRTVSGSEPQATVPSSIPLSQLGIAMVPRPSREARRHPGLPNSEAANQAEDWESGVQESDHTALNSREFVFFGYFQRIRQRLEVAWVPMIKARVENFYRSGRHFSAGYDHQTKVIVILNDQGAITRVRILESSGILDLDDSAVEAFNQAGPFPNPPKALLGSSKEIEVPWDFVLRS